MVCEEHNTTEKNRKKVNLNIKINMHDSNRIYHEIFLRYRIKRSHSEQYSRDIKIDRKKASLQSYETLYNYGNEWCVVCSLSVFSSVNPTRFSKRINV